MSDALTNGLPPEDESALAAFPSAATDRVAVPPAEDAREVLVFVNRNAGSRRRQDPGEAALAAVAGRGLQGRRVEGFDELVELSAELARGKRLRAVVAVGGDGTVGAVLNATPPGTPIAVAPAGTENLLAKYVRSPSRPEAIGPLLDRGVVIRLDAGSANGRLFALMVSAGFDAEVVRRVHDQRDGNITHLAYAKPILDAMRKYQYPPLEVAWSDDQGADHRVVGRWVFGVNLPRYAQGLPIAPEACGADGRLDLCVLRRGGTAAGVWYLWHLLRRRRDQLESVTTATPRRFRISSPVDGAPYQLDGDPGGVLPVDVSVVPGRLTLLAPRSTARRLGFDVLDP